VQSAHTLQTCVPWQAQHVTTAPAVHVLAFYKQGLARVFGSASKADVQAAFALYDTDGSGALDTAELCACIKVGCWPLLLVCKEINHHTYRQGRQHQGRLLASVINLPGDPRDAASATALPWQRYLCALSAAEVPQVGVLYRKARHSRVDACCLM
jgi:hypothetical protein